MKDRIGRAIIDAAEQSGELAPGGTIVEGTSGNTGIALAVGAARGYKVILTMPETMSKSAGYAQGFRAEIELTPGSAGMQGRWTAPRRLWTPPPTLFWRASLTTPPTPEIHRQTTAQEILRDTDGKVDIFVAGVGTGGTLTGVGQELQKANPDVQTVLVEPASSPTTVGGARRPSQDSRVGRQLCTRCAGPQRLHRNY